jgi:hypothetical protein
VGGSSVTRVPEAMSAQESKVPSPPSAIEKRKWFVVFVVTVAVHTRGVVYPSIWVTADPWPLTK